MNGGTQRSAYAGADRRQARELRRSTITRREFGWFITALVVAGALVPGALSLALADNDAHMVVGSLRTLAAACFVGSGLLRLARWRLTGEARVGLAGVALTVFGLVNAPLAMYSAAVQSDGSAVTLAPISRTLAVICFLAIIGRALTGPSVEASLGPVRMMTAILLPIWLAFFALMLVSTATGPLDVPRGVWFGVEILLAVSWCFFAAWTYRLSATSESTSLTWSALALVTMGLGEAARAAGFIHLYPAALSAVSLQVVAACVVAANAAGDLGEVFAADGNRLITVTGALEQTERVLAEEEERRQEQVHDARSVIAALSAASLTLERYEDRLQADQKQMLRSAFTSELIRLQHLIDPPEHSISLPAVSQELEQALHGDDVEQRDGLLATAAREDRGVSRLERHRDHDAGLHLSAHVNDREVEIHRLGTDDREAM